MTPEDYGLILKILIASTICMMFIICVVAEWKQRRPGSWDYDMRAWEAQERSKRKAEDRARRSMSEPTTPKS
jgi:hypothetical protein